MSNNNNNNNTSKTNDDDETKIKARPRVAATQPGVQSVRADAAARFDQRLADKLAKEEEDARPRQAPPVATTPGSAHAQLQSFEDAVQAKLSSSSTTQQQQPGVQSLRNQEDAVQAKIRRETPPTTYSSSARNQQLDQFEQDVQAKVQSSNKSNNNKTSTPRELGSLEDQVQAKIRRNDQSTNSSNRNSNNNNSELHHFEDRVQAKVRGDSNMPSVAAAAVAPQAVVSTLDQRIAAKMAANPSSMLQENDVYGNGDDDDDRKMTVDEQQAYKHHQQQQPQPPPEQSKDLNSFVHSSQRREPAPPLMGQRDPAVEYGVLESGQNGLAVAVAVEEEDDDMFIPSAIEYDPDAKPPMYRNRRFRLYAFLACFVIVVVAVGAAVGATVGRENFGETQAPTPAPTTIRESFGIRTQVERVVGSEVLEDEESPYSKALDWITFDDPMQLTPDDPSFVQRYIAAFFYFSTTVDGPWLSCGAPEDAWSGETECQFKKLGAIFPLTFFEVPWNRWLSNITECDWAGVLCDEEGQFRTLDLSGNELSGTFPAGIKHLPYIQSLTFSWCNFQGTLPAELSEMKHLTNIELHYNQFTGEVPLEWYESRNVQHINVGDNMISGTVPTIAGNLPDLKGLFLFTNMMDGSIPSEVGNLDGLAYFRLSRNAFTGTLPESVGNWNAIEEIWLHRNQLTGTISTVLGNLATLDDLRLHANPLTGTIPTEIYDLPNLERLDLWDCQLTGTLATEVGNLGDRLFYLRISGNKFSGPLPEQLANLTAISAIWINGNDFTGTVPEAVCALENAVDFTLEEFSADCLADESGITEISCPSSCCTICCLPGGTGCLETESGT